MSQIEARFQITRGKFHLDAELHAPATGVTALFGPSGCGKTTLLRAIAGLEKDPNGRLIVGDEVWQSADICLPPHQRSIGYVFQEPSLFPHLSVRENMRFGFKRVPEAERRLSFAEVSSLLGVEPLLDRHPEVLSGGERQRVAIARALLTSPRLLLMDEPLAALDEGSKSEIIPYLERLHDELKIPFLYVSHAFDEVVRIADHLALMENGSVFASGPISDILTRPDLPLVHRADAESMIEATVSGHDQEYHLLFVDIDGGRFTVASEALPDGCRVRLRVLARDVSIALQAPTKSSILNIFSVRVESILQDSPSQVTVALKLGDTTLLSRITRKSAANLGLQPGDQVFAQVKSVALLT